MNKLIVSGVLALIFSFGLVGCVDLKPKTDPVRLFLLEPMNDGKIGDRTSMLNEVSIGIRSVQLPAYLGATGIAVRSGSNEVVFSDYELWAEPLERGIKRVLTTNLRRMGAKQVKEGPGSLDKVDFSVDLIVEEFVLNVRGEAVLRASCRVLGGDEQSTLTISLHGTGPSPAENMSAAVSALSELVGRASVTLAESLKK